jgi:predicted O-methyltransferase YrrM
MSDFFLDHTNAEMTGVQKIMLATTAYDNLDASYTFSIQRSRMALEDAGFLNSYMLLSGNCHVDDARNRLVQEFLLTDCTDLVFIDADVSWDPESLIALVSYDCDIVGGIYPYRREGTASSFNMPILMIPGEIKPNDQGLIQVAGLPTGFMRIRRRVLETLARNAQHYHNDGDRRSMIPLLFERTYKDGTRWGGDLSFCHKWIADGGKVWAAPDLYLGHATKTIMQDSLGAALRRDNGTTLRYVTEELAKGSMEPKLFMEAAKYMDNLYSPPADVLLVCVAMAKKADGPIIEAGSGLTTILMAAVTDQPIYCLEHDPFWAIRLGEMIEESGVSGIGVCDCAIKDGWYDLSDYETELPTEFALGLNDGPPRLVGDRMGFYERFGHRTETIIVDDADDRAYGTAIVEWCAENGRRVDFIEQHAALIRREPTDIKEQAENAAA